MAELYLEDLKSGQTFGSGRIRIEAERIKGFAAEFDPQPPTPITAAIIPIPNAQPCRLETWQETRRNRQPDIIPYRVVNHQMLEVRLGDVAFRISKRQGFSIPKKKSMNPAMVETIAKYTARVPKGAKLVKP